MGERFGDSHGDTYERDTFTYHCNQSKVSLLFQVGFDELETPSRGLAYRLDEKALADSELDARVIRTQLSTKISAGRAQRVHWEKRTRLMHRYTVLSRESVSPALLLWMTSNIRLVSREVFSIRFVVASMSANAFASAAYGTLAQTMSARASKR